MKNKFKTIKTKMRYKFEIIKNAKDKIIDKIFKLPYLEKPLPKKNSISNTADIDISKFLILHKKAINEKNIQVDNFEKDLGFSINKKWFNKVSLITQTSIKKSKLNFNHGRLLYSLLCKYINVKNKLKDESITIVETGTARGFSSLCMSKALNDQKINGKIITLDCISHNEKMFWNCIADFEGKKSRQELLSNWEKELSNILFIQGWTTKVLNKLGLKRVHFAFLDAQHTKEAVLEEFIYISERQKKGDIVFFDDVTPNIYDGVCDAVKEIEKKFPYKMQYLNFDINRGYSIATKI